MFSVWSLIEKTIFWTVIQMFTWHISLWFLLVIYNKASKQVKNDGGPVPLYCNLSTPFLSPFTFLLKTLQAGTQRIQAMKHFSKVSRRRDRHSGGEGSKADEVSSQHLWFRTPGTDSPYSLCQPTPSIYKAQKLSWRPYLKEAGPSTHPKSNGNNTTRHPQHSSLSPLLLLHVRGYHVSATERHI